MFMSYGFNQQIKDITHIDGGTIDQVFSFSLDNKLSCISQVEHTDTFGSDHHPIYCNFNIALDKKFFKTVTY